MNRDTKVDTLRRCPKTFMATYAATNNKPSEVASKRSILDNHLIKACGSKRLDEINAQDVEDLKAKLLRTSSAKYVNNVLNVFRKMLRYAADLEMVARVPTMKALKLPPSKPEFLDFDDYAKLVEAARREPELYAAVLLAGEAGLRLGEIVELHWSDIDRAGVLTVSHNDWPGHLGSPKSGRARELPLTKRTPDAVRAVRHLRSQRVFWQGDGAPWTVTTMRTGLLRQEKRAGLTGRGKWATRSGDDDAGAWRARALRVDPPSPSPNLFVARLSPRRASVHAYALSAGNGRRPVSGGMPDGHYQDLAGVLVRVEVDVVPRFDQQDPPDRRAAQPLIGNSHEGRLG
jgi:integrase